MNRRLLAGFVLLAAGLALAWLAWRWKSSTYPTRSSAEVTVTIRPDGPRSASAKNSAPIVGDQGYGSVTGQIVLTGEIPVLPALVGPDDVLVPDRAICIAEDIPNESLIVDRATRGIANVFVYLPRAPHGIHPERQNSGKKRVATEISGCRYKPHALIARTDQQIVVRYLDECVHNMHLSPMHNRSPTFVPAPDANREFAWRFAISETRPIAVVCDLHHWMSAHWLILDHPYSALSDSTGKFTIADLPTGDYEFVVWHEKCGYINRNLKVRITSDATTELSNIRVSSVKFKVRQTVP